MSSQQKDWFGDDDGPAGAKSDAGANDEIMYVDVNGFEGPLDLLLELARRQKVDLVNISVLALAEQYLGFIETVRQKRIEVAADYLVMAAWLAYLKSRLMVPELPGDEEPSGEMMAAILQFRLKRLEAMRRSASQLMARPRLGRQIFQRGDPEPIKMSRQHVWQVSLFELLKAYGSMRERTSHRQYAPLTRSVWSLKQARDILERLIGDNSDWQALDIYLGQYLAIPEERATILASSFSASLELVRQGHLEMRQSLTFGPLLMRRRKNDKR
ncbi:Segregation and condensation protein A [hydrothermal vent metagenome]|uniref:Segregation and condensation protein A n=1 Tax=hydrothermal vent metagenome TaxID=652676 RepID=A0A3B0T7Q5_9ZZZZ